MFTNTACATAWGGVLLIKKTSLPTRNRIICFIKIRASGCSSTASIVRCWYLKVENYENAIVRTDKNDCPVKEAMIRLTKVFQQ